jgi:hypothetical protein
MEKQQKIKKEEDMSKVNNPPLASNQKKQTDQKRSLVLKPEERIQTAEGWKRTELKNRKNRKNDE